MTNEELIALNDGFNDDAVFSRKCLKIWAARSASTMVRAQDQTGGAHHETARAALVLRDAKTPDAKTPEPAHNVLANGSAALLRELYDDQEDRATA